MGLRSPQECASHMHRGNASSANGASTCTKTQTRSAGEPRDVVFLWLKGSPVAQPVLGQLRLWPCPIHMGPPRWLTGPPRACGIRTALAPVWKTQAGAHVGGGPVRLILGPVAHTLEPGPPPPPDHYMWFVCPDGVPFAARASLVWAFVCIVAEINEALLRSFVCRRLRSRNEDLADGAGLAQRSNTCERISLIPQVLHS